jgi:hypothetical protein
MLVQIFHKEAYGDRQSIPDLPEENKVLYSQLYPATTTNLRVGSSAVGADSGGEYSLQSGEIPNTLLRVGEVPKYVVEED